MGGGEGGRGVGEKRIRGKGGGDGGEGEKGERRFKTSGNGHEGLDQC